jgi:predicted DNA-binding protein (MmcQ/YjbR family)
MSSGGGPTATRTGKNPTNETVTDCMKLWEPATHMSKADWSRTCRRVQGRLDQVTKEVMTK